MTAVDTTTGEVIAELDRAGARDLTDRIKVELSATWDLITEAYQRRAWAALGFDSWDAYCRTEFGEARLQLPREEERDVVRSLRDAGLSIRAIASSTRRGVGSVHRDLAGVPSGTPAMSRPEVEPRFKGSTSKPKPAPKVTGTDGKTYTRTTERTTEKVTEPVGQSAVDLGAERTARSDAAYRESLSKARVKALHLTQLDPERCASVLPTEDREGELRFVERMEEWLDTYRSLLSDTRLRSVK